MNFGRLTVGWTNYHDVASGFGIEPLVLGFFSYILFLSEAEAEGIEQ